MLRRHNAKQGATRIVCSLMSVVLAAGVAWPAGAYASEDESTASATQDAQAAVSAAGLSLTVTATQDEAPYDIDWYLDDPESDEYLIQTADELRGLARLVNGTAAGDDAPTAAIDFAGRTIYLAGDIDLSGYNTEADESYALEFVPIGTAATPFAGTFDGNGATIRNLYITETTSYAGLFGYASESAQLRDVTLTNGQYGGVSITTETDYVEAVGSLVGMIDGTVSDCTSDVTVAIESSTKATSAHPYVVRNVGGLVGYARADISGCAYLGTLTVRVDSDAFSADTSSDSLRVADSFGGVVGRFGDPDKHGTLTDSYNLGDIVVQTYGAGATDRFGTATYAVAFFVGGVAGYSNGSILRCHNGAYDPDTRIVTGRVFTGVYAEDGTTLANNRGADEVGGIAGSLRGSTDDPSKYNDGDPNDPMVVSDCYNEAQITGLVATGGIVGQAGVYTTITRCYNGTITDLTDWERNQIAGKIVTTRWNKPLSGGIVGETRSGDVSYCANYAEVRNIQTGYYMAGIAGCIFTSDDYPNVTGEIYACFNAGGVYTINESKGVEYREAGICGDNEGYVHDCIVLEGSVPYHDDQAIGNMDWGMTDNIYVKSSEELQNPTSAALLNAIASQAQDWSCYWFINRAGYPVLNTWAALDDSQRIQLTADNVTAVQLEAAPYVGAGASAIPKLTVTYTPDDGDSVELVQDTDFRVIPQPGAYEMSASPVYSAGIEGIGLYQGTVEDCALYAIGAASLSQAAITVSSMKYNFGRVVLPVSVTASISGNEIDSDEIEYVIYGGATTADSYASGSPTPSAVFDSEGFLSYDKAGNVKIPISDLGVEAINASTADWWLWDRDGVLLSDSEGNSYYTFGNVGALYSGNYSCTKLKSGTPAGYVVEVSARSSSVGLSGSNIGYYVVEPIDLYRECVFEGASLGDDVWYWDIDNAEFYRKDADGNRVDETVSATFTGETIEPVPALSYGDYQLVNGVDIYTIPGDPNPEAMSDEEIEAGSAVKEGDANRNVTTAATQGVQQRAAITIAPVDTNNLSNYINAYFEIVPADFADCQVCLRSDAWAYTGEAVEPDVVVTLNGVELQQDKDYAVEYADNVEKGTASYTVTPLANLSGGSTQPVTGSFTIADGVEIDSLSIDAIPDQQFNYGYDVHPQLVFRDAQGTVLDLVEGEDYTVAYSTNKITKWSDSSYTTACTATITGMALYTGSTTATFDIVPYDAEANATGQLKVLTQNMAYGTWGKPATYNSAVGAYVDATANIGANYPVMSVLAYPIVDWEAYDAGDLDSCYGDAIVLGTSNNNTNGGLINRYPARYFDLLGNEVNGSGAVYIDTSSNVIAQPAAAAPGPMIVQLTFRTGTSGNKGGAVGTLTVGTTDAPAFLYTAPADLATVSWTVGTDAQRTYTGGVCTPVVGTTTGSGYTLEEGIDYQIAYSDNVDAGIASFTVAGVEDNDLFGGTYTGQFTLMPLDLSQSAEATIEAIPDQALVDATAGVEPEPVVTCGDTLLVRDKDYTVGYQNNHTVGDDAAVFVMGMGNYTGTISAKFSIVEPTALSGGEAIEADGAYKLDTSATGTISIAEGVSVTVAGSGIEADPNTDLTFDLADGATLTLCNVYVENPTNNGAVPFVEFNGAGTVNIIGENRIEMGGDNNVAAFHVVSGDDAHFGGTGTLYAYKAASSPLIGVNMGTADTVAVGDITFDGGAWYLAGTKMGPVIGNDLVAGTDAAPMGTVTINSPTVLYVKNVGQGAAIGGSKNGTACNVVINGGTLELYTDYNGSTIGAGGAVAHGSDYAQHAGTLLINGGSVKTVVGKNGYAGANATTGEAENVWAGEGVESVDAFAQVAEATMTAAHDTALLVFDASSYADETGALGTETILVKVDGTLFYEGGLYPSLTSEVKNPPSGNTLLRWMANTTEAAYPSGTDTSTVYPTSDLYACSTFAPDTNLYLHLTKTDHELTVNGEIYAVAWNEDTQQFSCEKTAGSESVPADTTALAQGIADAQAAYDAVIASASGADVPNGSAYAAPIVKQALADAIAAAQTVADDANASQNQIDDATAILASALATFDNATYTATTDASALSTAISAAESDVQATKVSSNGSDIDTSAKWVTSATVQTLTAAIASARQVLSDAQATQNAIDDATIAVKAAQAAFDAAKKAGTKSSGTTTRVSIAGGKLSVASTKVYTGKAIKPAVTVKVNGKKLSASTDYTVAYKSNKKAGKATVIVTGKGNYTGKLTGSFIIKPAKATGVKVVSKAAGKITISWAIKKAKAAGATGYQLYYKVAGKSAKKLKVTKVKTAKKTISKLAKGKKVTVKVRVYKKVGSKLYYGAWSAAAKTKIKKK